MIAPAKPQPSPDGRSRRVLPILGTVLPDGTIRWDIFYNITDKKPAKPRKRKAVTR